MTIRELFEAELDAHHIFWCQGDRWRRPASNSEFGQFDAEWTDEPCRSYRSRSNGRRHSPSGGAWAQSRGDAHEIHLGREVATRYGLQIGLHEVAHIVLGHTGRRSHQQRVFEREAAAEAWSFQRMEDLGVPVPEKARKRAEKYVAYRKRRGDPGGAVQAAVTRSRTRSVTWPAPAGTGSPSNLERTTGFEPATPPWQGGSSPCPEVAPRVSPVQSAHGYQRLSGVAVPLAARVRHVLRHGSGGAVGRSDAMDADERWETMADWLGDEPKGETIYAQVVEMLAFRQTWDVSRTSTTTLQLRSGRTPRSSFGSALPCKIPGDGRSPDGRQGFGRCVASSVDRSGVAVPVGRLT